MTFVVTNLAVALALTTALNSTCAKDLVSDRGTFFERCNEIIEDRGGSITLLASMDLHLKDFLLKHPEEWLTIVRAEGGRVAAFELETPPRWEILIARSLPIADLPGRWALKANIDLDAKERTPILKSVELSSQWNVGLDQLLNKQFAKRTIMSAVLRAAGGSTARSDMVTVINMTLSLAEGGVISSDFHASYLTATATFERNGRLPLKSEEASVWAITGLRPVTTSDGTKIPANGKAITDQSFGDGPPFAKDRDGGLIFKN